jgi:aryl-alcohol dehydrogenase-like predicted oxidoreductase
VVLATKGRMPVDDSPNGAGLSARPLTRALDASLRRLGLGAVDLYQVPAYDPLTPMEETLRAHSTSSSGPARSATEGCPISPAGS